MISIVIWTWKNGISPMPTSLKAKKAILEHLPPHLEGTIYELGSGWGTLAFALAKKYPRCTIIGYETSLIPYLFTVVKLFFLKKNNLILKRQDFFIVGFHSATMIVCYLYPGAMQQLKGKFEAELKKGTWVISNTFSIPNWKYEKSIEVQDIYKSKIYFYRR